MTRVATRNSEPPPVRLAAMGALYAIEGAALVCAMVVYKNGDRPFLVLFTGQHAPAFIGGILAVVGAGAYLALSYRRTVIAQRRRFWMTVAINAVTVMLLLAFGEATVRVLSSRTSLGIRFANTLLLPRSWDATKARNQALLDKAPTDVSYLIADASLGWTVAPSRQSRDGLYSSSAEGARSARPGTSYALDTPHPRIALVGDSFTFGLEVGFEDSWGARLQRGLDSQVHVLNFGVDGYGVDQAYLRYVKDVRSWRPDVVILGFINHDLDSRPEHGRVHLRQLPGMGAPVCEAALRREHGTSRAPQHTRSQPRGNPHASLGPRLAFVELDPGYAPHEWAWRPYHHSYLVRFLLSKFPRWPQPSAEASDKAMGGCGMNV